MNGISFRTAVPDDAPACAEILAQWVADTPWYPLDNPQSASSDAMVERILNGAVVLALDGDTVAGFLSVELGQLDCLYLARAYQGRGIGKALLDQCKAYFPGGFSLWTLAQNTDAQRFYQREGLIETARSDGADNEDNLPDIQFYWPGQRGTR